VWCQAGAKEPPSGWTVDCSQGLNSLLAPGGSEDAARRLSCSGGNFVVLGYGWVGFDSNMLPPTFHSCKHLFQAFSTSNQAFTLKQNIQLTYHMHNLT